MRKHRFPYVIVQGKMDEVDASIDVELSDEAAVRLDNADKTSSFSDNEALSDIYDDVYSAILDEMREVLLSNPSIVEDMLSWDDDYNPDQPITDEQIEGYLEEQYIKIYYPEEFD